MEGGAGELGTRADGADRPLQYSYCGLSINWPNAVDYGRRAGIEAGCASCCSCEKREVCLARLRLVHFGRRILEHRSTSSRLSPAKAFLAISAAPARHNTTVLLPSRRSNPQARHPTPHRDARLLPPSPSQTARHPPPAQHVDAPPPVRSASADIQTKSDCGIANTPHPATTSTDSTVHIRPAARTEICDRPPRGAQEQQEQRQRQ